MSSLTLFATAPLGIEALLADELRALGAGDAKETRAGVSFSGDLALAYRACLWSRLANRVLLPLAQFPAASPEALYAGVRAVDWSRHLDADNTLAVDFHASRSQITHTHFGALKVKDAIVDQFRERSGVRPSVATDEPDLRVNVYLNQDQASLSLDLSGESLHRRGYRAQTVAAPLKENLAAAILLRARWPEIAGEGGALVDLMCGSGTLPIEGARIAGDIAPGIDRTYYGFLRWRGHDPQLWESLLAEACERRRVGIEKIPEIRGYDRDPGAVRAALANVARAGLTGHVHIERRELSDCRAEHVGRAGLVVANPPYGERLGEESELPALYQALGRSLRDCYPGWQGAVFTGNPDLGKVMGLRAHKLHTLWNGAIECKLLHFDIREDQFVIERSPAERLLRHAPTELTPGAEMFANRLRKNLKQLGKWARQENLCCYRLYDADMPEYALAIDLYQGVERWAHVQEYAAPKTVDPDKARDRLRDAVRAIPAALDLPAANIHLKVRERQKGRSQYERLDERGEFHEVREDGLKLLVNFTDYLDTGLFLDHRLTRRMIGELAAGKRFLNLFCYTGAATVHAAKGAAQGRASVAGGTSAGMREVEQRTEQLPRMPGATGARSSTSIDMSRTYLDWARRNLALNGFDAKRHELIQADVLTWLKEERDRRYGLIFLDPPTFSTSKRMEGTLDIQRDHVALIEAAAALLEPDGTLIFSCNFRRFKLDAGALSGFEIEDLTRATIPKDFARNPRIHQCFRIRRRP